MDLIIIHLTDNIPQPNNYLHANYVQITIINMYNFMRLYIPVGDVWTERSCPEHWNI